MAIVLLKVWSFLEGNTKFLIPHSRAHFSSKLLKVRPCAAFKIITHKDISRFEAEQCFQCLSFEPFVFLMQSATLLLHSPPFIRLRCVIIDVDKYFRLPFCTDKSTIFDYSTARVNYR